MATYQEDWRRVFNGVIMKSKLGEHMLRDLFTRRECFCVGKLRREESYEIKT